jgi:hypothetical protein
MLIQRTHYSLKVVQNVGLINVYWFINALIEHARKRYNAYVRFFSNV